MIFLMGGSILLAQAPNSKWISVLDLPNQSVYMDTSSLKQREAQISVLILTVYKEPQLINSINKKVYQVKSQIFFITVSRKYSIVGQLYYDKDLKILGEMSQPGFASNTDNFSSNLEGNIVMTAVFTRSYELLNNSEPPATLKSAYPINPGDKIPAQRITKNDSLTEKSKKTKLTSKIDTGPEKEEGILTQKKSNLNFAGTQKDPSIKIISSVTPAESRNAAPQKNEIKSEPADRNQYENDKESNPVNSIFTDGSRYSFQVSSWRIKSKAESEAERLKKEGHNSFITEAIVKGKTWYRVRIGYFNSLDETESYMKKVR